jgi:hypothetical protein
MKVVGTKKWKVKSLRKTLTTEEIYEKTKEIEKKVNEKKSEIKQHNEIDSIFSSGKSKRDKTPVKEAKQEKTCEDDSFFDSRGKLKATRFTDDGFPIFTAEQLNIGKGGDTPDCPFDCKCCY